MLGAALSPAIGVAAVAAVGAGVAILNRPILGAYVLVACAPTLSGLQRGLPVPGFRLSEVIIVGIAAVVLISARETPRWGMFDWVALTYVVANGALVWANVARTGRRFYAGDPRHGARAGPVLPPLPDTADGCARTGFTARARYASFS